MPRKLTTLLAALTPGARRSAPLPLTSRMPTVAPATATPLSLAEWIVTVAGTVVVVVAVLVQRTAEAMSEVVGVVTVTGAEGRLALPLVSTATTWKR